MYFLIFKLLDLGLLMSLIFLVIFVILVSLGGLIGKGTLTCQILSFPRLRRLSL